MDSEKMQDKPIFFLDTLNVLDESSFQIKQKKQSSKWEEKKSAGQCIKGKVLRFSQWFCLQRLILWNHKVRYSLRPHSPDLPAVPHCCGLYFWFSKRPPDPAAFFFLPPVIFTLLLPIQHRLQLSSLTWLLWMTSIFLSH